MINKMRFFVLLLVVLSTQVNAQRWQYNRTTGKLVYTEFTRPLSTTVGVPTGQDLLPLLALPAAVNTLSLLKADTASVGSNRRATAGVQEQLAGLASQLPSAGDRARWDAKQQAGTAKGVWNPATNTPTLSLTASTAGDYYDVTLPIGTTVVSTSAATGIATNWYAGDVAKSDGARWYRLAAGNPLGDGVIGTAPLADAAVTPSKTTFLQVGKNLFNPNQTLLANSQTSSSNGTVQTNPVFTSSLSEFIPVNGSTTYVCNTISNTPMTEYDANKVFIRKTTTFNASAPVSTSATTRYIRLDLSTAPATFQLEAGPTPSSFETYRRVLKSTNGTPIVADALSAGLQAGIQSDVWSNVPEKVITPAKASFFTVGKNMFNATLPITANAQINSSGAVGTFSGWTSVVTDFFPVEGGATYVHNSAFGQVFAEYDANKVFIAKSATITKTTPYTTNANTRFFRMQLGDVNTPSTFMVEKGSTSTTYEAYQTPIQEAYLGAAVLKKDLDLAKVITTDQAGDPALLVKLAPGKNLFNPNQTILANSQTNSGNGTVQTNVAFNSTLTDFIPVTGGTTYVCNSAGNCPLTEYDANKVFIRKVSFYSSSPVSTSSTTRYVRIDLNVAPATFQMELGSTPTFFVPYQLEATVPVSPTAVAAATPGAVNRLSFPSRIYMLGGYENRIYFRGAVWRWNPNTFYHRIEGSGMKNTSAYMAITPTANTTVTATAKLYSADLDVMSQKTISLISSSTATNNGPQNWLSFGDSYSEPGIMHRRVLTLCASLTTVGTRKGVDANVFTEGYSGWKISDLFDVNKTKGGSIAYFTPFMQPVDPYRYYGPTGTWIAVLSGGANGSYKQLWATSQRIGFTAGTGYKASPAVNDVMWVDANNRYERWDGSAWVVIDQATLGFSFNFGKYRSVWQIAQPSIVSVMYGVNDFSSLHWRDTGPVLTGFKTQLDALIASVKADNPSVKIGVFLPNSSFWSLDNQNDIFVPLRNAAMFTAREFLIANYDNRTSENVWVVDVSSAGDPDYGSHKDTFAPFPEYQTEIGWNEETRKLVRDGIHPDNAYYQYGTRIGAWIQTIR